MELTSDFFQKTSKIFTVGELTRAIRGALETKFGAVWVQGEISNYKLHPSGHQYFTLKDARAQISCVIFRNTMPALRIPLGDGAQVQVYGQVSVFEARGQYQLSVQILQTRGLGLLQAKFEGLKRKLEAEGLFDPARKRALPNFPRRIGIVTSASGAAVRDILNVLKRRAPWLQILINPVRVQGTGAATEIAVAIRELAMPNQNFQPVDLILVARGGGSIEDLWEFNEEIVARTIVDVSVPIVSAIGHEIDFTICDFAADLRAPTPSAAAELIVPDILDVRRRIGELAASLQNVCAIFSSIKKRGCVFCPNARSPGSCSNGCATHSSNLIWPAKRCIGISRIRSIITGAALCTWSLHCNREVLFVKSSRAEIDLWICIGGLSVCLRT
jgi:exodeoxyribonuclease VII large subunit